MSGKTGRSRGARELERRGYAILARRYRTRHGEIDIVARDGETIVFVEVKARRDRGVRRRGRGGRPPRSSGGSRSMAADYLARHRLLDRPCRFDVVAIDGIGDEAVVTGVSLVTIPTRSTRERPFLDSGFRRCGTIGVLGRAECASS